MNDTKYLRYGQIAMQYARTKDPVQKRQLREQLNQLEKELDKSRTEIMEKVRNIIKKR